MIKKLSLKARGLAVIISGFTAGYCAAAGITSAFAADEGERKLSYTYLEAGYLHQRGGLETDLVDGGFDTQLAAGNGNGFYLKGSLALGERLYVFGSYEQENADYAITYFAPPASAPGSFRSNPQRAMAGLGFHAPLSERMDFIVEGGVYANHFRGGVGSVTNDISNEVINIDLSDENFSKFGGMARTGLRALVTDRFEVEGSLAWFGARKYANLDADSLTAESEFIGAVGARFHLAKNISLGASYELGNADQFRIGLRLSR